MFTGIIEFLGEVRVIREEGTNRTFDLFTPFDEPIRVDQSIAHNGVCLTVTHIYHQDAHGALYSVTAVEETLGKTTLGHWRVGHRVNVERCLRVGDRLDGHFVQGHVDTIGTVTHIGALDGSWLIDVDFPAPFGPLIVGRGSICVNGVSLTVVDCTNESFRVTIIPYTWEHTGFHALRLHDGVNLEFDILGKYLMKGKGW